MTIKEMMEIFELQIAAGNWDEDDEIFVRDDIGVFDTVDFFLKDSDGDIRIYSIWTNHTATCTKGGRKFVQVADRAVLPRERREILL